MKSIDLKSLIIGILGTALVFVLMGQSSVQREPDQVQCVLMEDTIGMGYVACRIFDMQSISKLVNNSTPDLLYTEREFWEFYKPDDL